MEALSGNLRAKGILAFLQGAPRTPLSVFMDFRMECVALHGGRLAVIGHSSLPSGSNYTFPMCGRVAVTSLKGEIAEVYAFWNSQVEPHYNVAPTGMLPTICEAIYAVEGHCIHFQNAANLLRYAGGIQSIKYSAASEAGIYCSAVAEFERKQEMTLTPFLHAQSVFTITWMGLESLIDEIKPSGPKEIGKIGRFCKYLKSEKAAVLIPFGYTEFINEWKNIEQKFDAGYKQRPCLPEYADRLGEGIYRVYCLRNHLFHGDFSGFDPEDTRWSIYTNGLTLGTRIIAITIQMALMASLKDAHFMETYWASHLFLDQEEVPIIEGFSKLHLIEN